VTRRASARRHPAIVVGAGERRAAVAERVVFEIEGRALCWDDVLAWARDRGDLGELERETRASLAALAGGDPPAVTLREAGAAFRYARGLLAADELEA
jgi:hypothetical protein